VVELLLARGADVHAARDDGSTTLMRAVQNSNHGAAIIRALIAAGANVDALDHQQRSVITWMLVCRILLISLHRQGP
jgi:ankyrin repeat protein